ncbi:hypothetical protein LG307_02510 [Sutcliffiella horikoshii]|uniref:hypothetical protein n=1 Tax=Sutcliffiella horikoshii TaxID=79883 RepID=UPI00385028E1
MNIKKIILLLALGLLLFLSRIYLSDLFWIVIAIEACIVTYIIFSVIKSIIGFKNKSREDFNINIRKVLEQKFGKSFLIEFVIIELNVFYYSLLVWFKKSRTAEQNGKAFTYHRSSEMKTFIIVFAILITGEGILFHYLLQKWNEGIAWIFTILNVYGLLYLVGFYNSAKHLPHMITQEKMIIRLGFQSNITIDIANIEQINRAKEIELGMKIPKTTYYSLLKLDTPHAEITLKEPVEMRGSYGMRKMVDKVVFRADDRDELLKEIKLVMTSGYKPHATQK